MSDESGQLWTRELVHVAITWAPDSSALAASARQDGRVRLYATVDGAALNEVPVVSREEVQEIVDLQWYSGVDGVESSSPSLAVCFVNGLVQIFEHATDEGRLLSCLALVSHIKADCSAGVG